MSPNLLDQCVFLYGAEEGRPLAGRIQTLVEQYRSRFITERSSSATPLSEQDVLLISYGDQVREPGIPPLRTLHELYTTHLSGWISGVHVLPFYPSSSDDGFAVVDYLQVDPALGTWEDVARLAREADLMVDGVFNHLSAQSGWFKGFLAGDPAYRDFFVTVQGEPDLSTVIRPRALPLLTEFASMAGPRRVWTTFSADQVDLNYQNPEVFLAVLEVLLAYIARGARFIRLDAIAFLWKEIGTSCLHLEKTHRVIQCMRQVVDGVAPGVRLITETNVPHADNISYFGDGTNEAHLVYNFALPPLVLHTLRTGDAKALSRWAAGLSVPTRKVAFLNFLASHDGIGLNPVRGILADEEIDSLVEGTLQRNGYISYKQMPDGRRAPYEMNINYLDALAPLDDDAALAVSVSRLLSAHAIMLAMPGVPAIYFHSLFGSRGDRAGAESSGMPRRINREKLDRDALERALKDGGSLRARVFEGIQRMIQARRRCPVFNPSAGSAVVDMGPGIFALRRSLPEGRLSVLCIHNITGRSIQATIPTTGQCKDLLTGETVDGRTSLILSPYQNLWLRE